jgi:hypothetical protein
MYVHEQDRKGALFFVVTNECIDSLMTMVMLFHSERLIFIKEHSAGAYGTFLYYIAKNLAQVPFLAFFPTLFSAIVYWMVRSSVCMRVRVRVRADLKV